MKKLLLIAAFALATLGLQGASSTVVIAPGGFSNLLSNFRGSAKVTDILITAPSTNTAQVRFIDTYTNSLTYVSPAYSNIVSYATNVITSYTNFFGVTQSFTNVGLIDITNSVAATTNNFPVRWVATASTNSAVLYPAIDTYFVNGIWATNVVPGSTVTVTITYQQ